MKLKIIGYLISHTDSENIWIELQKVYNDLCPEDDVEFEEDIFGLLNENRISYSQDDETIKISLRSNVDNIINGRKQSAIQEMKDNLKKCLNEEEYEKAQEWQEMINEYE